MHVQVFTLGGSFQGMIGTDKGGEIFNGNNWRETAGIDAAVILSDDPQGVFRVDNYGYFFAWTGNSGTRHATSRDVFYTS